LKKYLPIFIVLGVILLVLVFLTYWEPPQRDALDDSIWQVTDLNREPLIEETTLTIRFHNGKVNGSSGCNRFTGRYKIQEEILSITIREATTDNCLNPGIMDQERAFMRYLQNASGFQLEGQELTIFTGTGGKVVFTSMLSNK